MLYKSLILAVSISYNRFGYTSLAYSNFSSLKFVYQTISPQDRTRTSDIIFEYEAHILPTWRNPSQYTR